MRILLIEDDARVAAFLVKGLTESGYAVDHFSDGRIGMAAFEPETFDLVILDWMIPGADGLEVCEGIRKVSADIPILFLTVKDTTPDKVAGFEAGADDYLTKPFSFLELLARVRALMRRGSRVVDDLTVGSLKMSITERTVLRGQERIDLSNKEFSILEYLMRHRDRLVTRAALLDHVWNLDFDRGSNVVDVYISYLRKKLDDGSGRTLIHTVRGAGYRLKEPTPEVSNP